MELCNRMCRLQEQWPPGEVPEHGYLGSGGGAGGLLQVPVGLILAVQAPELAVFGYWGCGDVKCAGASTSSGKATATEGLVR